MPSTTPGRGGSRRRRGCARLVTLGADPRVSPSRTRRRTGTTGWWPAARAARWRKWNCCGDGPGGQGLLLAPPRARLPGCRHGSRNRVPPRPVSAAQERTPAPRPLLPVRPRSAPAPDKPRRHAARRVPTAGLPTGPSWPPADDVRDPGRGRHGAGRGAGGPGPGPGRGGAAERVHRRLTALGVRDHHVRHPAADVPLADPAAARVRARHLTRHGSSTAAVRTGVELLARVGGAEDAPVLRALGRLRNLFVPVVHALDRLNRPIRGPGVPGPTDPQARGAAAGRRRRGR